MLGDKSKSSWPDVSLYDAGQDRQHFMLTTMDTLGSVSHGVPSKDGEVEKIESLPTPVSAPAEQTSAASTFLLANLPSYLGALWTSSEPGNSSSTMQHTATKMFTATMTSQRCNCCFLSHVFPCGWFRFDETG